MSNIFVPVFVLIFFLLSVFYVKADESYGHLFRLGTEAYSDNDWTGCVDYFEKSLKEYKRYCSVIAKCRSTCKSDNNVSSDALEEDSLDAFFQTTVHIALCLLRCERDGNVHSITKDKHMEQDFVEKVPYDYLQLCYFKLGNPQKAASSAYTFLQHNPDHDVMRHNLNYYLGLPSVDKSSLKYLELEEYQDFFLSGVKAYANGQNMKVVEFMEQALSSYLKAELECHLFCEGSLIAPAFTSFLVTVANHYTNALRCKSRCPASLSSFYSQHSQHLLSSILHYLQFAYYKTGKLESACQAVASYLLLNEHDSVMLENKVFYMGLTEAKVDWFTVRKDVLDHHRRQTKIQDMLTFIDKAFNFKVDQMEPQKRVFKSSKRPSPSFARGGLEMGVKVIMDEENLGAKQRIVAEGLTTTEQCERLMQLAQIGATLGDGYNGSHSPHTEFESFEGLTIGRAISLLQSGSLSPVDMNLLLDVSDRSRRFVESVFNPTSDLHFAYTHLVCRTARPELAGSRSSGDLSHPIHADNCLLTPGGQCLKQRPAYVWRDYSAILYLNKDFEGGEFFFAQPEEKEVEPQCGRLVAFSAGLENLHGVRAVKKGRRCALAMWYTLDPRHQEKERHVAAQAASERLHAMKNHVHTDL